MRLQVVASLCVLVNAHFLLNYPTTLGFDQNTVDNSPCGGAIISFSKPTSFHVAGDAIAVTTLHPQSNFLYRATLDQTATNWTVLSLVTEYGLGAFCEPALSIPAAWVGSQGLLQVVQNAEDGVHYQCAAVNFIAGVATSMPSQCQNASGNSAAFTSDTTLLPASGGTTPTATGSTASTSASKTASPSASATKTSGAEEMVGRARLLAGIAGALLIVTLFVQ